MRQRVRFKRVFLFLALTFGLSWGFELLVAVTITQAAYLETGLHPMGMFFPAFSALLLQIFVFRDSPLYFRVYKEKTRWVSYSLMRPHDKVFSFGLGIYGLIFLAVVVVMILRDPVWRQRASPIEQLQV